MYHRINTCYCTLYSYSLLKVKFAISSKKKKGAGVSNLLPNFLCHPLMFVIHTWALLNMICLLCVLFISSHFQVFYNTAQYYLGFSCYIDWPYSNYFSISIHKQMIMRYVYWIRSFYLCQGSLSNCMMSIMFLSKYRILSCPPNTLTQRDKNRMRLFLGRNYTFLLLWKFELWHFILRFLFFL